MLEAEELDPVAASIPTDGSLVATVMKEMTARYGIKEEDFVSGELHLVPARMPADVGLDRGLTGGYGQDDRLSSYCAARAVMDLKGTPKTHGGRLPHQPRGGGFGEQHGSAFRVLQQRRRAACSRPRGARSTTTSTCASPCAPRR